VYVLCGDGYLGGGATDRRESLPDVRYGSQTGLNTPFGYTSLRQNPKF